MAQWGIKMEVTFHVCAPDQKNPRLSISCNWLVALLFLLLAADASSTTDMLRRAFETEEQSPFIFPKPADRLYGLLCEVDNETCPRNKIQCAEVEDRYFLHKKVKVVFETAKAMCSNLSGELPMLDEKEEAFLEKLSAKLRDADEKYMYWIADFEVSATTTALANSSSKNKDFEAFATTTALPNSSSKNKGNLVILVASTLAVLTLTGWQP